MLDLLFPYRVKKYSSLIGSTFIHLSLGSLYTFGNLTPYMISYLRETDGFDYRYSDAIYIWTALAVCLSLGTVISGALISFLKFKIKTIVFIGCALVSSGCLLTFVTIKSSYFLALLTYGILNGVGTGFCYMTPLSLVMKWFPEAKGFANSVVLLGFGAGPIIFNQIQTIYINPNNYSPDKPYEPGSDEKYFSQPDLLARVPKLFLIQGSIYLGLELIGLLIMAEYHENPNEDRQAIVNDEEGSDSDKSITSNSELILSDEINSIGVRYTSLTDGMELKEAVKRRAFYLIAIMLSFSTLGSNTVITYYKTFGQTFIKDDHFFAITGSIGGVFNSFGRLFWGYIMDRHSFKSCFLVITTLLIALVSTFYLNKYIMIKEIYTLWICAVFFVNCGIFTCMPTIVARCFGQKHFNAIYGLMYFIGIPSNFISSELPKAINSLGYFAYFIIGASLTLISWISAFIFNVKNSKGQNL